MSRNIVLDRYIQNCTYPGTIDPNAVDAALRKYVSSLGVTRNVVQLDASWSLDRHPSLKSAIRKIADDTMRRLAARDARDAQAARDALDAQAARDARAARAARDARDALTRFAHWCIQSGGWWSWRWEISWIATTHIGALQLKKHIPWAEHLYDAFCSGAWFMFWTNDTLYWVAKPRVHVETIEGRHRLHRADGPAVESDIEPLYFWHGVLIPAEWIEQRDTLAASEIFKEQNAETRRAGCEIIGWDRVLDGIDAKLIDNDGDPQIGALYEGQIPGATKCTFLKVQCGTGRTFVIPTPSGLKSAIAAQAWIANKPVKQWKSPEVRG